MELVLVRDYFSKGTNGTLWLQQQQLCFTIERPWKNNEQNRSCIPEGKYPLKKRYSQRFGWHVLIDKVLNRSLILIHPANYALKELNGCIAPVTSLTGEGIGSYSKKAFEKLRSIVFSCFERGEEVNLIIKSKKDEYTRTYSETHLKNI